MNNLNTHSDLDGHIDDLLDGLYYFVETSDERFNGEVLSMIKQTRELIQAYTNKAVLEASEIFVPVKGFEAHYEVSNTGKVRSPRGVLKQSPRGRGYLSVSLSKDNVSKSYNVHRLVAQAFLFNPEHKRTVNHKDGNPANNHVSNLEWATYQENEQHAYQTLGKINNKSKLTPKQAIQIKACLANGESVKSLANEYGVSTHIIYKIKEGKSWQRAFLQLQKELSNEK